jgi:hypothetical protein
VLMEGARRGESESLRWLVHVRFDWEMRTDVIAPELHARSRLQGSERATSSIERPLKRSPSQTAMTSTSSRRR